jgi:hypothetical protein
MTEIGEEACSFSPHTCGRPFGRRDRADGGRAPAVPYRNSRLAALLPIKVSPRQLAPPHGIRCGILLH